MNKTLLSLSLALACTNAMSAEPLAPALPATLDACADLRDAQKRLACFDREVALLRKPAVAVAAVPAPVVPVAVPGTAAARAAIAPIPAPAKSAASTSSFGQELLGKNARPEDKPVYEDLHATITALREVRQGEYRLTLDNGQTWGQLEPEFAYVLKVGEPVTIKRGALGSYRLFRDKGSAQKWVRVTRTQ